MATTELHKVPDTILSRCQEFEFRTIPLDKIYARLKIIAEAEKIDISDDALRELARSGEGSMRDAQSNFDQVISFSGPTIGVDEVVSALGFASSDMLSRVISGIDEGNARSILSVVDDLIARGHDLRNFSRDMLAVFRDLLVYKVGGREIGGSSNFSAEMLEKHAAAFSETDLLRFFNSLADTELKLRDAAQSRFVLEMGLVKLMEMRRLAPIEDVLKRIADLESTLGKPGSASAAAGVSEKKTLKSEPSRGTRSEMTETRAAETSVHEELPEEPAYFAELPNTGDMPADTAEPAPLETPKPTPIHEFVESIPVRLPPISSEELEHVEDKWLDNAYEGLLMRLGDDLKPIPGASAIVERIAAAFSPPAHDNGVSAAAAPSIDLSAIIPVFDDDEHETIPELPPDPTEAQLLEYAEKIRAKLG